MFLVGASNGTMLFPWIIGQLFSFSGSKGLKVGRLTSGELGSLRVSLANMQALNTTRQYNTLGWPGAVPKAGQSPTNFLGQVSEPADCGLYK